MNLRAVRFAVRAARVVAARATRQDAGGHSLIDLLFAMALMAVMSSVAAPALLSSIDDYRAAGAVRYFSSRVQRARLEAVKRSTEVALRLSQAGDGRFEYVVYLDGNGNGVRTRDIERGTDRPLGAVERLPDQFPGVDFGVLPGLPPVESGSPPPGNDPIKLGSSNLLSFSALGTSSSGSVYVRGQRSTQYVIRVFGDTGKVRTLKFFSSTSEWNPL